MKKFAVPFIIAAVAAVFAFTGCTGNDTVIAPEDTWCKTTQTISGTTLDCYFYYTQEESTTAGTATLEDGLTVIVVPTSLSTKTYAIKNFPLDTKVTVEDPDATGDETEDTSISLTMKGNYWDAIFLKFYKDGFSTNQSTEVPDPLVSTKGYTSVNDIAEAVSSLSWKKVLKQLLASWLDA